MPNPQARFRERLIKGNDKAQLQLGLAYMEGAEPSSSNKDEEGLELT